MDTFDIAVMIFTLGGLFATVKFSIRSWIKDNKAEHLDIINGIRDLVQDCKKTNAECREDLRKSHNQFMEFLNNYKSK